MGAKDKMDITGSVDGRSSDSILRRSGWYLRTIALVVLAAGATACGGGSGGGDDGGGGPPPPTGDLRVTVTDSDNIAVSGASVQATSGSTTRSGTTAADGTVSLNGLSEGNASVTVSRDTFVTRTVSQAITAAQTANLTVVLQRTTRATGGVVTTRVGTISPDDSELEFSVTVVVVDENSVGIDGLTQADFTLLPCTPDAGTPDADCVRSPSPDVAYTVLGAGNPPFTPIPGKNPADHYAAALLFDQSRSIIQTDPSDARLFSAKEFLRSLGSNGGNDVAIVAAFARDINVSPNGDCLLPACVAEGKDVTIFPYDPPTVPAFTSNGTSYLATLDELAGLEGGGTPLYVATDELLRFTRAASTGTNRKAVVLFTDGRDETCGNATQCQAARDATIGLSRDDPATAGDDTDVDIFTIGLAGDVDGIALAELADGGNGTFLFAEDAAQLIPIYGSLGNLLSGSLTTYELRFRIEAPAGSFAVGNAVRGVVEVDLGGGNIVRLPFIVRIFT